jgi:hypothetical protein
MAAGTKGVDRTREEGRDSVQGSIVGGHAYSILDVHTPLLTTETIRLLKMRNPWGSKEWTGAWSDKSEMWAKYPVNYLEKWR